MAGIASDESSISVPALLHLYERLGELPEPVLDLSIETQTLSTILDVAAELEHLAPQLVPLACQLVLRELGRIPPAERATWLRRILPLAPPQDDAVVRAILERIPAPTVLTWILNLPGEETKTRVQRLQSLFHAVSYEGALELIDALGEVRGENRQILEHALPILRAKLAAVARSRAADCNPEDAASLLRRLSAVGGKQVVPIVTQLLPYIDGDDCVLLELALTTLATANDQSMASTVASYLKHVNQPIRLLAARILLRLGGESALASLAEHVRRKSCDLRETKAILSEAARQGTEAARVLLKRFVRPLVFSRKARELRRHAAALLENDHAERSNATTS